MGVGGTERVFFLFAKNGCCCGLLVEVVVNLVDVDYCDEKLSLECEMSCKKRRGEV